MLICVQCIRKKDYTIVVVALCDAHNISVVDLSVQILLILENIYLV